MSTVKWEEWMSVGLDRIDADHKQVLALLGDLEHQVKEGAGREKILASFDGFIRHIRNHFSLEESLFRQTGFSGAAEHAREHKKLLTQIVDMQKKIQSEAEPLNRERLNFITNWLVNHILISDKKYATDPNVRARV